MISRIYRPKKKLTATLMKLSIDGSISFQSFHFWQLLTSLLNQVWYKGQSNKMKIDLGFWETTHLAIP